MNTKPPKVMKAQFSNLRILAVALCALLHVPAAVQAQFNYVTNVDTITITGYTGPGGDVSIPEMIDDLAVTCIEDYAFANCDSLTSVVIGNSVTSIGDEAFDGCTSLISITVGNNVTSIGDEAFHGCISLTNVTLPASVASIGDEVFNSCTSLTTITVDAFNIFHSSVDGVVFNKSQTALMIYPRGKTGSYTIPNSVIRIEKEAFQGCRRLTGVTIPESVTSIGSDAFESCRSLTCVTIPNSVTNLAGAFGFCSSLTNVVLPNSVTSIAWFMFQHCTNLISITIPTGVRTIGNYAFYGCLNLTSVTIPNNVININDVAFAKCTSLTTVNFGGNAPGAGLGVFSDADNVIVYYLPGTTGWGPTFGDRPTEPWSLPDPVILDFGPGFGVQTNGFGFIISWATNNSVRVEACTELANPIWYPVGTNTFTMGIDPLTDGWSYFNDPDWTSFPARFYRVWSGPASALNIYPQ